MSKWDDFKKSVGSFADKTANKTRELTDTAALKIKIANKEADRDTEYRKLGKLAYAKLRCLEGTDPEALTEEISATMDKLDEICSALAELKREDEARKSAKQEKPEEKKEEKKEQDEELDMQVMAEFNEARQVADVEYEKAKQAAEDAK